MLLQTKYAVKFNLILIFHKLTKIAEAKGCQSMFLGFDDTGIRYLFDESFRFSSVKYR